LLGSSLLTGCAGTSLTSNSEIQAIRARQEDVARAVAELKAIEEKRAAEGSTDEVRSSLEDVAARLDRLENQLRDLLDGLSRAQVGARKPGSTPSDTGSAPFSGPEDAAPPDAEARALYDSSYTEVTRGHYDLAITSFEEFLRRFPTHDLADNALYWIGESHYVQREFQPAVDSFVKLLDAYPQGDKVPAALLKLGYAFGEEGEAETSQRYLERLVTEFPQSDEAQKARDRLAQH